MIRFVDDTFMQDTASFQGEKIILNEYYKVSVQNSLHDTIYLTLSNLNTSKNKAVLPSKIITYNKSKLNGAFSLIDNYKMENDLIVAIPSEESRDLLFYMPECSDTSTLKGYLFLVGCNNDDTVVYQYMEVLSTYQNNKIFQKARLVER